MALVQNRLSGGSRWVTLAVLSAGLIFTHYTTTYVIGFALLFGAIALSVLRAVSDPFEESLPLGYPVVLLAVATGWYWYGSPALFATLVAVPANIVSQLSLLLGFGAVEGTGAGYVQQETALSQRLQLVMYGLFAVLMTIGLGWLIVDSSRQTNRGETSPRIVYTAVALPLLVFLAASYFFVLGIWVDRVYQMVLVVLAPAMPLGYLGVRELLFTSPKQRNSTPWFVIVAVLLVVLFALNSGLIFAAVGGQDPNISTFNGEANDLAFTDEEREAVTWLRESANITQLEEYRTVSTTYLTVKHPERTQVYTDPASSQLFRGLLSQSTHDVEVLHLKNRWEPEFAPESLEEGYVFIRERSVKDATTDNRRRSQYLTTDERESIISRGTVVFENRRVTIVRITNYTDD
jgi:uncharacterized membrane protein